MKKRTNWKPRVNFDHPPRRLVQRYDQFQRDMVARHSIDTNPTQRLSAVNYTDAPVPMTVHEMQQRNPHIVLEKYEAPPRPTVTNPTQRALKNQANERRLARLRAMSFDD